eukprot:gene35678-47970_t
MTARAPAGPSRDGAQPGATLQTMLPRVSTNALAGLIEEVDASPFDGRAAMADLADQLQLEIDELFPMAETLQLMRFAELHGADIELTPAARRYAQADVDSRKAMFAQALLAHVPLAQHIRRVLDERAGHVAPARRFRDELEDHMSPEYADETLRTVTHWGRYAEVFAYDEADDRFSLEDAVPAIAQDERPSGAPASANERPAGPVTLSLVYTADLRGNVRGGIATGTRYLDNVDLQLSVDADRLIGWKGARLFVYGLYNNGTPFSTELVGDVQSVSNVETDVRALRLFEAWIEQDIGQRGSLKFGLYNLNAEFDTTRSGGLFLLSSHGIGPDFSQSGRNGPSIFPVTSLALRGEMKFGSNWLARGAVRTTAAVRLSKAPRRWGMKRCAAKATSRRAKAAARDEAAKVLDPGLQRRHAGHRGQCQTGPGAPQGEDRAKPEDRSDQGSGGGEGDRERVGRRSKGQGSDPDTSDGRMQAQPHDHLVIPGPPCGLGDWDLREIEAWDFRLGRRAEPSAIFIAGAAA